MTEEKETEQTETDALPAPANRRKMLLIAGAAILVVGVGTPVGYFMLGSSERPAQVEEVKVDTHSVNDEESHGKLEGHGEEIEFEEGEEALGAIVPFETFLVNLSGGKYIRLQLQVEFETPDVPRRLHSRMVPIRDGIISLLTQQTSSDLEDIKGKEKLKKSVKDLINERLHREDVRRVYFTQFVIQ
jgi:flagellar basal body-associated protein FliL